MTAFSCQTPEAYITLLAEMIQSMAQWHLRLFLATPETTGYTAMVVTTKFMVVAVRTEKSEVLGVISSLGGMAMTSCLEEMGTILFGQVPGRCTMSMEDQGAIQSPLLDHQASPSWKAATVTTICW